MGMVNEQWAFLQDVALLINKAKELNITLTAGEMYRTPEQQKIYFDTGKSKTMNSNHLKRLAVDFNFFINGKLTYDLAVIKPLGIYWESLNTKNRWGGNFTSLKDSPHFERNI